MSFSFFRRKENVRKANVGISKLSKGRNYQGGPEIKSEWTRHSMIGGPNGAFVQINVKLPDSKPADLLQFVVSAKSTKKHIAMPKVKKTICKSKVFYIRSLHLENIDTKTKKKIPKPFVLSAPWTF